ncbi:MAG: tetratricopeptide repeat protein [Fidelibacterota bacterium]
MESPSQTGNTSPPPLIFRIFLILLPLLFFLGLELTLRLTWDGATNLALFIPDPYSSQYFTVNQIAGKRYFSGNSYGSFGTQDTFLKQKPADGIRIFVLGGSSTAGYPYMYAGGFPAMLRQRLEILYPENLIEVINLGMTAVNSYTVRDFALECMDYNPDALVIYTGHNEFYGALGTGSSQSSLFGANRPLIFLVLKVRRLATYRLIRSLLTRIRPSGFSPGHQTLMARMARNQHIEKDGPLYRKTLDVFQKNMQNILVEGKNHGIPIVIGSLASNVKNQPPFVSIVPQGCDSTAIDRRLQQARNLMDSGRHESAHAVLDSLIQACPGHAKVFYTAGQCATAMGDSIAALTDYTRARDYDGLRFRASSDLNHIIKTLCQTNKSVYYSPVEEAFQDISPGGIIGNNLILEHLHPNLSGYYHMARTFAETLIDSVLPAPRLMLAASDTPASRSLAVTRLDSVIANMRIRLLTSGWPFTSHRRFLTLDDIQPQNDIERLALAVLNKTSNYEKAHVQLAQSYEKAGQWRQAVREYRALAATFTNNDSPLKAMGKILVDRRQFSHALPILLKTLRLVDDGFSYKWAGTILLNQQQVDRALPLLEKGKQYLARDTQLLYNLSGAYYISGQKQKAIKTLNDLLRIDPGQEEARQFLSRIQSAGGS